MEDLVVWRKECNFMVKASLTLFLSRVLHHRRHNSHLDLFVQISAIFSSLRLDSREDNALCLSLRRELHSRRKHQQANRWLNSIWRNFSPKSPHFLSFIQVCKLFTHTLLFRLNQRSPSVLLCPFHVLLKNISLPCNSCFTENLDRKSRTQLPFPAASTILVKVNVFQCRIGSR